MSNIEVKELKFKINCLINFINEDIKREKYRISIRKEYEKEDDVISLKIAPWYKLLVEEGEQKVEQLESYVKKLEKIKKQLESDNEFGDIDEGDTDE